ncbi:MAG: AzlC family ABC transporter permease, partial [Lachnospiraceae bacterium]|nr:AzlC family ABC transporter permease [Lachnospiraceae bacterium]
MKQKQQFLAGCRSALPVILGFVPVGIAYAIMARQAGFSIFQTCSLSLFVFAGASQIMAVGMWTQKAGILAIVLATFILNLRHLIMSTCVMNRMQKGHPLLRILTAFGVTDESFAIFTTEKKENDTVFFFAGLVITTYISWNLGTLAGAIASSLLPEIVSA